MATISKMLSSSSTGPITTSMTQVIAIHWTGASTPGHSLVITDANSNIVFRAVASVANDDKWYNLVTDRESDFHAFRWNGVTISTLSSGTVDLYIY